MGNGELDGCRDKNTVVTECRSSRISARATTMATRLGGKALSLCLVTKLGFVMPTFERRLTESAIENMESHLGETLPKG